MPSDAASPEASLRKRRPSTTAETIASAAKHVEEKVEAALLLLWDELPSWRRDNAFIVRGYRQTSNSYWGSVGSLWYLHNEFVNIWTHLLGALGFTVGGFFLHFVIAPRYESASDSDVLVFACFFLGAFLCLGMSATYHTLCNHSPEVAKWGNKLDYTGIVFLIVGSYVPALYYGLFCHPFLMAVYLATISILGFGCIVVSWFEHFRTPAWRPYRAMMFVGLGASGVVPIVHIMATEHSYQELNQMMGLNWVLLQAFLYIFGAFLYAARWPERQAPGIFDIWGSSHQIFHICVILAAASHFQGMAKAFDFHHSTGAHC